jgi:hypothetical protein
MAAVDALLLHTPIVVSAPNCTVNNCERYVVDVHRERRRSYADSALEECDLEQYKLP